ncbi:hypothetical protein PIB30_070745 [Stylosanthes scabra]|uniref:Uncharacterized protein n=1 Tax=Stylosanthes scabra TaxID=79078 RepID=A0ABU6RNJ0_9FABA|nr:hypothetical protein [Stylosanthes scabra]
MMGTATGLRGLEGPTSNLLGRGDLVEEVESFGGGGICPHQLYPDFVSPSTIERQLGGEVCYADLAAIWAQEDVEASGSCYVVDTPQFHVDLNEPATGLHVVYFSFGGTPPSAFDSSSPSPAEPQPAVHVPVEDEDDVSLGRRACRVPRCRGCETGGHI